MKPNLVLWLLGGSGVFLLYSAVKGYNPASLVSSYFTGGTPSKLSADIGDDGTTTKNGVVDPKSRGPAGPLLDPNNPNNLDLTSVRQYVGTNGQIQNYPAAYQASPATFIGA